MLVLVDKIDGHRCAPPLYATDMAQMNAVAYRLRTFRLRGRDAIGVSGLQKD